MTPIPAKLCPSCRRAPASAEHAPFCSRRCADIDLQRWFSGRYAVPGAPVEGGDDEDA